MSESETDWEFPASRPWRSIAAHSIAVDRETSLIVKVDSRGSNNILKGKSMLVLSRKTSERILIGDEIAITIVRIGPNSVRVGIEAPKTMSIVRGELAKELVDALKHDCD